MAVVMLGATAQNLTTPPNGGNKKASVSKRIGITDISIHYYRPGVKGREGKIWNGLVHTGFAPKGLLAISFFTMYICFQPIDFFNNCQSL